MHNREEAARLLLAGNSPSKIAAQLRLPLGVVMNSLYNQVGLGRIRRSDILFSIDADTRHAIEKAIAEVDDAPARVRRALARAGIQVSRADLDVYLKLRDSRVDLGDMYELLRDIELKLHDYVRASLIAEFGEADWWRQGVPLPVREDCAVMCERDAEPAESLYCYTTVMNLRLIFEREWSVLSRNLPGRLRADKQAFLQDLVRVNRIRNVVMHPVKGIRMTEDDFDFVRRFHAQLTRAEQNVDAEIQSKSEQPSVPNSPSDAAPEPEQPAQAA
jgi:hypothetical protein